MADDSGQPKKDLTGLGDYFKNMENAEAATDSGPAPAVEPDPDFPELEAPAQDAEAQAQADPAPSWEQPEGSGLSAGGMTGIPGLDPAIDSGANANSDEKHEPLTAGTDPNFSPSSLATGSNGDSAFATTPEPAAPEPEIDFNAPIEQSLLPPKEDPSIQTDPPPPASPTGDQSLDKVRNFARQSVLGKNLIPAAFPFSLLIEGDITPEEKEKLVDLVSREHMGISDVDLEPQLAGNRVLIPRISEYAGILLVQALRGTRARVRLAPSDSIFSTVDTRESETDSAITGDDRHSSLVVSTAHAAEDMPVTSDAGLPGMTDIRVIDMITASAVLKTTVVDAEHSSEYQEVLEGLQREIKYKAHYRGAAGITRFSIQLIPLSMPSQYRLIVMGSAVKASRAPASSGGTPTPGTSGPSPSPSA